MKNAGDDPNKVQSLRKELENVRVLQQSVENEYQLIPPSITFTDRLAVQCGDVTLQMIYFGKGHSSSDILVFVKEEGVLVAGSAFNLEIPPKLQNPYNDFDRWLDILGEFIDMGDQLKYIITGHLELEYMQKEDLVFIHDYYRLLWDGLRQAKKAGLSLEEAKSQFSIENKFSHLEYFKTVMHSRKFEDFRLFLQGLIDNKFVRGQTIAEVIRSQHDNNIDIIYRQLENEKSIMSTHVNRLD